MTDTTNKKGIYVRHTYGYIYSGDLISKAEGAVTEVTALAKQVSDKTDIVIEKAGEVDTNTTTAQNAANKAFAWATQLDTPVEDGEYSAKYWALQSASLQADWTEVDATKSSYIKHKPTLITQLSGLNDVSVTGVTDGESLIYDADNTGWKNGGVKANTSLDNITVTGKSSCSKFGMPSSIFESWTLGSSGDTHTAPANGWVRISKTATNSAQYLSLNVIGKLSGQLLSSSNDQRLVLYVPVVKGDTVEVTYNVTGTTNSFKFYYAEGEV